MDSEAESAKGTLTVEELWKAEIKGWYGEERLRTETICVPPVYFSRVQYRRTYVQRRGVHFLDLPTPPKQEAAQEGASAEGTEGQAEGGESQTETAERQTAQPADVNESIRLRTDTSAQVHRPSTGDSSQSLQPCPGDPSKSLLPRSGDSSESARPRSSDPSESCTEPPRKRRHSDQPLPESSVSATECKSSAHMPVSTERTSSDSVSRSEGASQPSQPCREGQTPLASEVVCIVQQSDRKDDFAQQHILVCLKALGDSRRPEPMFIISNLKFRDFLRRGSSPRLAEGEFDIILVNQNSDICVGEIKSIGLNLDTMPRTDRKCIKNLAERVKRAFEQLQKQKTTMRKKLAPGCTIRTTLMLPYVSRVQLRHSVTEMAFEKKFKQVLEATDFEDALQLCVCSDDVSDRNQPWHVPAETVSKLEAWYKRRFRIRGGETLKEAEYLDTISRLAGPATVISVPCPWSPPRLKVEVRTDEDAVSQVGERFSHIVLTPEQVSLLNSAPRLVWLNGPPGTGKTVAAVEQGIIWMMGGWDVHVVSCDRLDLGVSITIHAQLEAEAEAGRSDMAEAEAGRSDVAEAEAGRSDMVEAEADRSDMAEAEAGRSDMGQAFLHEYDFYNREEDVAEALKELRKSIKKDTLRVIVDDYNKPEKQKKIDRYNRFFTELPRLARDVCVWITSTEKNQDIPDNYETFTMTIPLRCPPLVLAEVKAGLDGETTERYSERDCHEPSRGRDVIYLEHTSGPGHSGQCAVECRGCGENVFCRLRALGISVPARETDPASNRPPQLRTSDCVILTYSIELEDNCAFAAGLREQGIDAVVLPWREKQPASDEEREKLNILVTGSEDKVVLTNPMWVNGLEKKVVVVLTGQYEEGATEEDWYKWLSFYGMSRCNSQLIVVKKGSS